MPDVVSDRLLWRYLTIVAALFVPIFVPFLLGFEWAGWRLGATVPLSTIAREQQDDHKLLWLGGFKDYAPYKLERIKLVQPEVLLVGSSRCGQAREQIFRPYKTYNACLTAWPLDHVVDFIDRATTVSKPRVVIVALDYFLFGDRLANMWRTERTMDYWQGIGSHTRKLHEVADFARRENWSSDVLATALSRAQYEPVDNGRLVGTEAIRGRFGFRADGSMLIAPGYRDGSAAALANVSGLMLSFYGAPHLSERQFKEVVRLSRLAKERGFTVVGIQFPILKSAADFLDTDEYYRPNAGPWRELGSSQTAERFARLGIRFFDMSRDPVAAESTNFSDPIHPTERGILRTIISLLDHKNFSDLFPNIDKHELQNDLSLSPGETFDLYH
jgi:hypothetical protein